MKPINVWELVIMDIMSSKPKEKCSFVQIGAHDGYHLDPMRPFVERMGWRGVLVEPQPEIFKRLVTNYDGFSDLSFESVAIYEKDCPEVILNVMRPNPGHHDHSTMLASFLPHAVSQNGHGYRGEVEQIKVPGVTLETLFSKYRITELDVLQIDAEGFDIQILKMLAKTKVRPRAINFEHAFYSQAEILDCFQMLTGLGYRIAVTGIDTVCYLQEDHYPRHQYETPFPQA